MSHLEEKIKVMRVKADKENCSRTWTHVVTRSRTSGKVLNTYKLEVGQPVDDDVEQVTRKLVCQYCNKKKRVKGLEVSRQSFMIGCSCENGNIKVDYTESQIESSSADSAGEEGPSTSRLRDRAIPNRVGMGQGSEEQDDPDASVPVVQADTITGEDQYGESETNGPPASSPRVQRFSPRISGKSQNYPSDSKRKRKPAKRSKRQVKVNSPPRIPMDESDGGQAMGDGDSHSQVLGQAMGDSGPGHASLTMDDSFWEKLKKILDEKLDERFAEFGRKFEAQLEKKFVLVRR